MPDVQLERIVRLPVRSGTLRERLHPAHAIVPHRRHVRFAHDPVDRDQPTPRVVRVEVLVVIARHLAVSKENILV